MAITQDRLKELMHYDPDTGIFTWLARVGGKRKAEGWNAKYAGTQAGCVYAGLGYATVSLSMEKYYLHRLAWLYMTGEWPPNDVDHINGVRHDNRWINLRLATRKQNLANAAGHFDSTSGGVKGVSFEKWSGKWKAQIYLDGKNRLIGRYATIEEAKEAYLRVAVDARGKWERGQ